MTTRPLWADAFNFFDYCFYTVTDLVFIVFGLMIVLVVSIWKDCGSTFDGQLHPR